MAAEPRRGLSTEFLLGAAAVEAGVWATLGPRGRTSIGEREERSLGTARPPGEATTSTRVREAANVIDFSGNSVVQGKMTSVRLSDRSWSLGSEVGSGGFGQVVEAASGGMGQCVAKLVPKDPGAGRELLFVDLDGVRNVVPVIDSGEAGDHWILVMPRAECSLRDRLDEGGMSREEAVAAMEDVTNALVDLARRGVVHRDIKPENTLLLDGQWCLGDFGISRYAAATTATDTRMHALTAAYAAPERWRAERATAATDVYSLGVLSYEMLCGKRPFTGSREALREGHLHRAAPTLDGVGPALSALVAECMAKPPGARPSAGAVAERLGASAMGGTADGGVGLARLRESNLEEVASRLKAESEASARRSAAEVRRELSRAAETMLQTVSKVLYDAVRSSAPAAEATRPARGWTITLGDASLNFGHVFETSANPWMWEPPAFDVVAHARIAVNIPVRQDYGGRSHSLWYCDAREEGRFQWFETAFMVTPVIPKRVIVDPFALDPGEEAAQALWRGLGSHQVAWPFEPVDAGRLEEFIDRWASWFADAVQGGLRHPSRMPERSAEDTWRR